MDDPEIILNLWYVYDDLGMIYSLRGRCYLGSGSDAEKLAFLQRFAPTDYLIAQPFSLPERLQTLFVGEERTRKVGVIGAEMVELMGGLEILFEEVLVELEKQLPAQTHLSITRDPLVCVTPLIASEDGSLKAITSPGSRLRSQRNTRSDDTEVGRDVPEKDIDRCSAASLKSGNSRAQTRPKIDLISAAMSVQGGQIPLEADSTLRLRPSAGDYLLCIRCTNLWSEPPVFDIIDFWEFREGDQLLITNREQDYPASAEQMEEGGPSVWKLLAGDRLTWIGWRTPSNERKPALVALVNCLHEGYVYGEPALPTPDSVMSFGAPSREPTPEIRSLWMVGFEAATALGLPRTWQPPD